MLHEMKDLDDLKAYQQEKKKRLPFMLHNYFNRDVMIMSHHFDGPEESNGCRRKLQKTNTHIERERESCDVM